MGFHCNGRLSTIFAGSHTAIQDTGPKQINEMFPVMGRLIESRDDLVFSGHDVEMGSREEGESSPSDEVMESSPLTRQNTTPGNLERARVSSGIT